MKEIQGELVLDHQRLIESWPVSAGTKIQENGQFVTANSWIALQEERHDNAVAASQLAGRPEWLDVGFALAVGLLLGYLVGLADLKKCFTRS